MIFTPGSGYVEVEPITADSIIASDDKKFVEMAKVIQADHMTGLNPGEIIFFRPHGFFETPEYEGKKHYVIRAHEEFLLGKMANG